MADRKQIAVIAGPAPQGAGGLKFGLGLEGCRYGGVPPRKGRVD